MIAVALIPLLKVVAGITAVNLVGEVVYHVLTKEKIKEECEKKFKEQRLKEKVRAKAKEPVEFSVFEKIGELEEMEVSAKIIEKSKHAIKAEIFWADSKNIITDHEIQGDEVSDDINIGDTIVLFE